MEELYWITRLDAISTMFQAFMIAGIIASIIFTILYLIMKGDSFHNDENAHWANLWGRMMWVFYPIMIIGSIGFVFTPTTKDAYMIYGLGGTIDYLKADSTAVQLPHKVIDAIDLWTEKIMPEDNYNNGNNRRN